MGSLASRVACVPSPAPAAAGGDPWPGRGPRLRPEVRPSGAAVALGYRRRRGRRPVVRDHRTLRSRQPGDARLPASKPSAVAPRPPPRQPPAAARGAGHVRRSSLPRRGCRPAGDQTPTRNLAPIWVWVIWWVGFAFVSALAGNLWAAVNPWAAVFGWVEALVRRAGGDRLGLAWRTLDGSACGRPSSSSPPSRGSSWSTAAAHSRAARSPDRRLLADHLDRNDPLRARRVAAPRRPVRRGLRTACPLLADRSARDRSGRLQRVQARPVRPRRLPRLRRVLRSRGPGEREWNLRPYGAGLQRTDDVTASMVVFVLLLLSTVAFDGFTATPAWAGLEPRSMPRWRRSATHASL